MKKSITRTALEAALLLSMVMLIPSCSDDSGPVTPGPAGPEYTYAGCVLNVSNQDLIRIDDGKPDRKLFVYPGEERTTISFSFLDRDGKVVTGPDDSVVVILDLDDTERFSIHPNALPDPTYKWFFSVDGTRIGETQLRITFLPESACKSAIVTVHAVG